jgi:K+-sensing histidine kinase KdpD
MMEALTTGLVGAVANTCFALLALVLLVQQPGALALLLVLFAALVTVSRAYVKLSRGHSRLELLYRFTRGVAEQVDVDLVATRVLHEARDVTQSGHAELRWSPTGDSTARRLLVADGDGATTTDGSDDGWSASAHSGQPMRWTRGSRAAIADLGARGLRDALAVPLQVAGNVLGVLAVAQRPTFLPTYSQDDLRMFQSLADHAAVALHNVALVEELRAEVQERQHEAFARLPHRIGQPPPLCAEARCGDDRRISGGGDGTGPGGIRADQRCARL